MSDFAVRSRDDQIISLDVGAALDSRNASEFKTLCQEEVANGGRHFVLNFSETGILDSTGLGAIFSLYRRISPDGGKVVFASVSQPVKVVVQLTRTYKVFRQFPTVKEARNTLRGEQAAKTGETSPSDSAAGLQ